MRAFLANCVHSDSTPKADRQTIVVPQPSGEGFECRRFPESVPTPREARAADALRLVKASIVTALTAFFLAIAILFLRASGYIAAEYAAPATLLGDLTWMLGDLDAAVAAFGAVSLFAAGKIPRILCVALLGLNPFVLDFLSAVDSESITLHLTDPLSPAVFRATGDDQYSCVIMPMRI